MFGGYSFTRENASRQRRVMAKYVLEKILPQVPKRVQPYLKIAVERGDFSNAEQNDAGESEANKKAVLLGIV